ncbi:lasso peptide biosynthesis B2 protein [Rubrobacter taiwanensis]|uniref:Lasso peptide biosynthesis B2 protein n=1 Tax=Rubrobacter taiwanensis TaxID=185139 RepID=A0A4R1BEE1_9ACTN|nr:lasso peptide biosynthesis B2 protein [Rubrobacter taiwanensis]TCJ15480.1 lasso peptide biosynthesis B2 protein [Rubrobacter taiwanensis]
MRSATKRLRRLLRRPAAERRLLLKAALLLTATRLGLWLLPFQTLRDWLARLAETPFRKRDDRLSRESVVWAVETAGRYISPANTCLTQALATQVLLARRGYPALLHIGVVRGEGGRLEAHAWVESEGSVVIGGFELERYTPLATLERGNSLGCR